jgi:hypothetical protein
LTSATALRVTHYSAYTLRYLCDGTLPNFETWNQKYLWLQR